MLQDIFDLPLSQELHLFPVEDDITIKLKDMATFPA